MNASHTPWKNKGTYVENSNNETVAQAFRVIGSDWFSTTENARLFAAAPDLLAALKEAQQAIHEFRTNGAPRAFWHVIEDANKAAIAKATGTKE